MIVKTIEMNNISSKHIVGMSENLLQIQLIGTNINITVTENRVQLCASQHRKTLN